MTEAEVKRLARGYKCACGGQLRACFRFAPATKANVFFLRCDKCGPLKEDANLTKVKSNLERYQAGEHLPIMVINNLEKRIGGKIMETTALTKMDANQMLARINQAKFPQELTLPQKQMMATIAISYGLDPLMGELMLYQGRPYTTVDAHYRKAQETGQLDGVETRPATKTERTDWQIPDGDFFFRSEVFVKGCSRPFVGWGRVYERETKGNQFLPTVANPQRMAEKRAERQALRKAFHFDLPAMAEDIGNEDAPPVAAQVIEGEPVREVDTKTGEIKPEPVKEAPPEAIKKVDPPKTTDKAETLPDLWRFIADYTVKMKAEKAINDFLSQYAVEVKNWNPDIVPDGLTLPLAQTVRKNLNRRWAETTAKKS